MNVTVTNKAATLELFEKFPETKDIAALRNALCSKPRFGSQDSKDVILLTDLQNYDQLARPIINANANASSRHGTGRSLILALPETPVCYKGGQERYAFTLLCKDPAGKGFAIILPTDISRYWDEHSSDWDEEEW